MTAYQTAWVQCIKEDGFSIDYLGVWNERAWGGPSYIISLRNALDAAGFSSTKLIIPDGGYDASIIDIARQNATFAASFSGVGLHYPCQAHAEVQEFGKLFWASEDWWSQPTWPGAATWGHLLNQNYVIANMTTTIAWSPLWSVYPTLEDQAAGLMYASEPWSGHWEVSPPIWTSAQWTQFTRPGWRFLSVPSGSSGRLPGGGTYVSLIPPDEPGLTIILETFGALSARCAGAAASGPQALVLRLTGGGGGMPQPGSSLFAWQTNATAQFVRLDDVLVTADGTVSVTIGVETMLTLTTVAGGRKGAPSAPIPPSSAFPLPYTDDFSMYAEDAMARYFADQFGSFAVRGGRLTQLAPVNPGHLAWSGDADPFTIIGDVAWRDIAVEATVYLPPPASLRAGGADGAPALLAPCNAAAKEQQWAWDAVARGYLSNTDASGAQQCLNAYGCQRKAVFWSCVTSGGSCCGANCYDGLIFSRNAAGQIASALAAVGCLTAAADERALTFAPCAPAGLRNQSFSFHAATGLLELSGAGACLSQPPPPPPPIPYAQVCARLASYSAFARPDPPPGACVSLASDGAWRVSNARGTLANGTISAPGADGVALRLVAVGASFAAFADGVQLANVSDPTTAPNGMVGLGSAFGAPTAFGAFSVKPSSASTG